MALRVLSASHVEQVSSSLNISELLDLAAISFKAVSSGRGFIMPQRLTVASDTNTTLFMPASMNNVGTTIKVVSVPTAREAGLSATTLVLDDRTGAVKGVVNARKLTALRTAAGSALATKLLANPQSENLVAFGAGAQVEEHLNLITETMEKIKRFTIINRSDNSRLRDLSARLAKRHPLLQIETLVNTEENRWKIEKAITEADIICTATSSTEPLFSGDLPKPGCHINLIGSYKPSMHEVETTLIRRARRGVFVDSITACLEEAGEIIEARLDEGSLYEIGTLIDDPPTWKDDIVTIFKSVGLGLQDVTIATRVLEKAEAMGIGTLIENYDEQ